MRIINSIAHIQRALNEQKRQKKSIGFVPTMGAFHEGHLSLMRYARRENDVVVVSIFVNPKQFSLDEDFRRYPRKLKVDEMFAKNENVDIIFYPSERIMYPTGYLTNIEVLSLSERLCGKQRPNHFAGVTTVVGKLLNIISPNRLYLGQKDAQQAVIIKQMIQDLNFPVKAKVCPIVRDKDGLALSSRNKYLNPQEREEAPILYRSLKTAKKAILQGSQQASHIIKLTKQYIRANSSFNIDYVQCVDANSLIPRKHLQGKILIALAGRLGHTRLIDNIIVRLP